MSRFKKPFNVDQNAIRQGWRSGLEKKVGAQLDDLGVPFEYEKYVIQYVQPAEEHDYTPDFVLPNWIVVETKGRWTTADRKKMRMVRKQHPDIDIRLVFSNPNAKISKGSKTTYSKWCDDNGYPHYSARAIPSAWLAEPPNLKSMAAIQRLKQKKPKNP